MDKKQVGSGGGVFFICLGLGIIFDNIALGIICGLLLGGGAAKAIEKNSGFSAGSVSPPPADWQ